jgi:cytochrome c oxidase subunit 2
LDIRTVPEGSYEIGVQAFKWGWTMDYGRGTYNPELHMVVNEPTKLTMKSSDVIHSLYIPAFRAKKDIVPGRYNYMWFQPTVASEKVSDEELAKATQWTKESGEGWDYEKWQFTEHGYRFFDLYCTEYCGKNHSEMQTVVVVHETQEDLDAWIKEVSARGPDVTPEAWGKLLYERRGCKGCHSLDGSKLSGPTYKDAYGVKRKLQSGEEVLFDENYVRESIINPKAKVAQGYPPVMPSFKGQLSDDDIYSITEFIKTQSSNTPAEKPATEEEKE